MFLAPAEIALSIMSAAAVQYSGFSNRQQENKYNKALYHTLFLL
jgi:hypothetical protein